MNGAQLIPFTYSSYKEPFISAFEFYGDYVYAGISNSGMIIRSKDRYTWEKFYQTPDVNISSLKIYNGYLYIGTTSEGNIYRINISGNAAESFGAIGNEIVEFVIFNEELYVAINGPIAIFKLNTMTDQFDFVYTPYAKVNQIKVIQNNLYVVMNGSNIVRYDGSKWTKVKMGDLYTNVSSYKHINQTIASFTNTISASTDEEILSLFPIHSSNGINKIEGDGTSIIIGSTNYMRVYRLLDDSFNMIFNTDGESVGNLLNINVGVNIASSQNKLYLIHSGSLVKSETASETTSTVTSKETVTNPNEGKNIVVTYPNGNEEFELGQSINITWSSTKGINDAVKLELINGKEVALLIDAQTSNSGEYPWDIPLSLAEGNYKIRITWLSAGSSDPQNVDESDNTFSVVRAIITTTTTTTTAPNPQQPDISSNRGITILELPEYENIVQIVRDDQMGGILLSTSKGRVIQCGELAINGFLTGERLVYADVYDGCGYIGSAQTVFNYALYKKLAEISSAKEVEKWKYGIDISGVKTEKITAVFMGPIVNIRNDFGFWSELNWEEIKPVGSEVTIFLRAASTSEELMAQPWVYSSHSEIGEIGTIVRSLNNTGLKGQYLQIKVEMTTEVKNIAPSVTNITMKYSSKNASYFFTNKFTIDTENPVEKGLLTATISQPVNTEIQFGLSSVNTADWNEYQVITPDKMFDYKGGEVKIGIKFVSYDSSLPVVSEFAVMFGGNVLKGLNN
jgi:hypothetical protein